MCFIFVSAYSKYVPIIIFDLFIIIYPRSINNVYKNWSVSISHHGEREKWIPQAPNPTHCLQSMTENTFTVINCNCCLIRYIDIFLACQKYFTRLHKNFRNRTQTEVYLYFSYHTTQNCSIRYKCEVQIQFVHNIGHAYRICGYNWLAYLAEEM